MQSSRLYLLAGFTVSLCRDVSRPQVIDLAPACGNLGSASFAKRASKARRTRISTETASPMEEEVVAAAVEGASPTVVRARTDTDSSFYQFMRRTGNVGIAHAFPGSVVLPMRECNYVLFVKEVKLSETGWKMYLDMLYGPDQSCSLPSSGRRAVLTLYFLNLSQNLTSLQPRPIGGDFLCPNEVVKTSAYLFVDNTEHALLLARQVLFPESRYYLNFSSTQGKQNCLKASTDIATSMGLTLHQPGMKMYLHPEWYALEAGGVLSLYGLRNDSDYDLLFDFDIHEADYKQAKKGLIPIGGHHTRSRVFQHHHESVEDLLYDSRFYGFCFGLKFISISQIYRFKQHRGVKIDKADIALIGDFFSRTHPPSRLGLMDNPGLWEQR